MMQSSIRGSPLTLLLFAAAFSCGDGALPVSGAGVVRGINAVGDRGVNESVATAEGEYVVFRTTGPSASLLVTDGRLTVLREREGPPLAFAVLNKLNTLLAFSPLRIDLWSVPALESQGRIEIGEDLAAVIGWDTPLLCAMESGWAVVSRNGGIALFDVASLRQGRSGRCATTSIRGVAADPRTRCLVICGDTCAETYDVERMRSEATCKLPCKQVGRSVCAADGTAWIATEDGFLRFDIASATVVGQTVLAEEAGSHVRLDLAASGKELVACCSRFVRRGECLAVLKIYKIEGEDVVETRAARVNVGYGVGDVTIIEKEKTVIVGTTRSAFAWHYDGGEKDK